MSWPVEIPNAAAFQAFSGAIMPTRPWSGALMAAMGSSTMARAELLSGNVRSRMSHSPLTWLQILSKGALYCPPEYNLAIGSSQLPAQIAQLPALAALNPRPRFCGVYFISNDIANDRSLADIFADVATLLNGIISLGITPIVWLNHVQNERTLAQNYKWAACWRWLLDLASKDKRVVVVNGLDLILDPASTDTAARQLPNMILPDNVHLNNRGSYRLGKAAWDTMKTVVPLANRKLLANWDIYNTDNPSGNLLRGGCMLANGGTVAGGTVSGDIAQFWNVTNGLGGTTVTGSLVSGGGQQYAFSGTATVSSNRALVHYQDVVISGKDFAAGQKVFLEVDIEEDVSAGFHPTQAMLRVNYGAGDFDVTSNATYQVDGNVAMTDAWEGNLRTPSLELTGVPTSMRLRIVKSLVDGATAPSGAIRIKGAQARKETAAVA